MSITTDNILQKIDATDTFTGTGTVIDTIEVASLEWMSLEITGVNATNQISVRGRLIGGSYEDIWNVIGNMSTRSINISKFDEIDIQCVVFSGTTGTVRVAFHDSNIDNDFENIEVTETISGVTYTATAKEPDAATTSPVWSIKREYTTGGVTFTQWANSGYYISDTLTKRMSFLRLH